MVEPHIAALPDSLAEIGNLEFTDMRTALQQADILALLVNHRHFVEVDRDLLKEKIVIDTRGMWR